MVAYIRAVAICQKFAKCSPLAYPCILLQSILEKKSYNLKETYLSNIQGFQHKAWKARKNKIIIFTKIACKI